MTEKAKRAPVKRELLLRNALTGMNRKRILFIDDEYLMREMMYELLTDLGYDVRTEESGAKGVTAFRESPGEFDLVLTDLMMFEMAGDRVSEEIHAIRSDIPVVVMTARPDRITPERASVAGVCKVLSKGMTRTELDEALRGVLQAKRLWVHSS